MNKKQKNVVKETAVNNNKKEMNVKKTVKKVVKKSNGRTVKEGTVAQVIVAGLVKELDMDKILKNVLKAFPKAHTNKACVAWYKTMIKKGEIKAA